MFFLQLELIYIQFMYTYNTYYICVLKYFLENNFFYYLLILH